MWAAVGSAVGLGSIWRFPYIVGENGGATFVFLYLVSLVLVGLPVLIAEILIGRTGKRNVADSFKKIGKGRGWERLGHIPILTGFLVSGFYALISGWTLGYFIEALIGRITHFASSQEALAHFHIFSTSLPWVMGSLSFFLLISFLILCIGVQNGIEKGNKVLMPLLLLILFFLAIKGLFLEGGKEGFFFIFKPDWSKITPQAILFALGQAFFSLSIGQGTMITYGSYLRKNDNIIAVATPITLVGILVSLLAGIATFTIVFSAQLLPSSGESLMFQTLPFIFSKITGGYFLSLLFFLLLIVAALTSQISAMEPLIAYFIDTWRWTRKRSAITTAIGVWLVALPCILSFGPWKDITLFGKTIFNLLLYLCLNILIPCGGLSAVILVGWRWGFNKAFPYLKKGGETLFNNHPYLKGYCAISIQYIAPVIIVLVMLDALGII